ncbi:MAG: aldo/keto reductase [Alphaproteobacteria bacterium]
MQYRTLGSEKLRVSAVGLGCRNLSDRYGRDNDAAAIAVFHRAIDLGVTLMDTADMYATGDNEELLALALKGKRDQVVLASKFGITRGVPDHEGRPVDGRPEYVRTACERSLKRLKVETIDLYYVHRVDPAVLIEDTVGAMVELKNEGKIRYIGLSEAGADTLRRANAVHPITALQSEYSLWTRDYEKDQIPACRELGIGFVAYYPMGQGFLSGTMTQLNDLAPEDRRRRLPRFTDENISSNIQLLEALGAVAEDKGCTLSQLALAWILAQGDHFIPIPGTSSLNHLEENVAAADVELTEDDLARINEIIPPDGAVAGDRLPGSRLSELNI